MFIQPGHDLDEVARPGAIVELRGENAVPAVAAGTRGARQTEDEGGTDDARGGAALDRRGADLGVAEHVKRDREAVHPLLEQGLDRLRRDVAAGKTRTAGGDDGIDAGIGDPSFDDDANRVDVVDDDLARRKRMT